MLFQKRQRDQTCLIWCQSNHMAALLLGAIHTRPEQRKLQNKSACNNASFSYSTADNTYSSGLSTSFYFVSLTTRHAKQLPEKENQSTHYTLTDPFPRESQKAAERRPAPGRTSCARPPALTTARGRPDSREGKLAAAQPAPQGDPRLLPQARPFPRLIPQASSWLQALGEQEGPAIASASPRPGASPAKWRRAPRSPSPPSPHASAPQRARNGRPGD